MFNQPRSKRKLLAACVASNALAGVSGVALAQNAPDAGVPGATNLTQEEVVVRGIRSSLERSLDIKRESNQVVEAITADDIGKMPDQNIAESLQRLPGVQIDRRDGQGTSVRIRGLDQNITLLNGENFVSGMEYFQLGEWKQEFDSSLEGIPSELLGGVEVYKTPVASMVEGGMGGVVNLKTRSGFDLREPLVAANLKVDYGLESQDAQPNGFVVFGNNWNDRFAAIASLSMSRQTVKSDYIQNFSRENTGIRTTNSEAVTAALAEVDTSNMTFTELLDRVESAGGTPYVVPGMYYVMDNEQERERLGGSINLQWRPTDALELGFDWFHADLELVSHQYTVKHPMNTDAAEGLDEDRPYEIDDSQIIGVVQSGSFVVPGAETNSAGETAEASADNFALKADYDAGGRWRFSGGAFYATAEQNQRAGYADARFTPYNVTSYVGTEEATDGWSSRAPNAVPGDDGTRSYSYVAGDQPRLSWDNSEWLSNPDYMMYKSHWALGSDVEQDNWSLRVDAEYDINVGHLRTMKFGVRAAEKETDFKELRFLSNFSETEGAMSPTQFNEDGSVASPTTFDPTVAPGETNAGVQEAVYYDLCGNGGIPAGETCDIDGDGIDDNRPFGPWGYFHDAAIGLKAFELQTSSGLNMAEVLYGDSIDGGRWDGSPGYIPWETFNDNPDRYVERTDFFSSGSYQRNILFHDAEIISSDVAAWHDSLAPNTPSQLWEVPLESWTVTEMTSAFYTEADFEGDTVPYTLNIGVRAVNTEVEVASVETTPESSIWSIATDGWNSQGVLLTYEPITNTKEYWDILPSMNFVLNTTTDTKLRFSAAKVIARPNLQDLGKGFSKNFTRFEPEDGEDYFGFTGGAAGNPELDPFRATQADVAYEWYFNELDYVSLGAFFKAVDSFIALQTLPETHPDFSPDGQGTGGVDRQINGDGGSVKGIEFSLQQSFDLGLGYAFNYTFSDTITSTESMTHDELGLPGVSQHAFNLIGFYENEFLSARVAYSWRDEYLSPYRSNFGLVNSIVDDVGIPAMAEFYEAYGQLDANVTWDLNDNLSLTAEAMNILGEEQRSYLEFENNPMTFLSAEPRVVLGVNYRM